MKFDAIAGASKTGTTQSGSGSVGGNTPMMNADLMVNVDLYANAKIFESLKIENAYAKGILDRLEGGGFTRFTAIFDKETGKSYKWSDFINTVVTARAVGKYLTVADYINTYNPEGKTRTKKPKEVLEDNLLGDLEYGSVMGAEVPDLDYKKELVEGEDLVIKAAPDYVSKIKKLCPDRDKNLSPYSFKIMEKNYILDKEKGEIIIKADGIRFNGRYKVGKLKIYIVAEGYDTKIIEVELKEGQKTPEESQPENNPGQSENKPGQSENKPDQSENKPNQGQEGQQQEESNAKELEMPSKFSPETENNYLIIGSGFGVSDAANWIANISDIIVDGTAYNKNDKTISKLNENEYRIFGPLLYITRPKKDGEVTLTIKSKGYKTYTFSFDNTSDDKLKETFKVIKNS